MTAAAVETGVAQGPEWLAHVLLTVNAHVRPASTLEMSVHPEDGRVVFSIVGSNSATVHLFTPRAELVRLIEAASAGLVELDAQTTALAETVTEQGTTGVESAA